MGIPTKRPPHTTTKVSVIPHCDLHPDRSVLAYADARMVRGTHAGSWANLCRPHFDEFGCDLGAGKGQAFMLEDRRPDWKEGDPPSEENDWACQFCGKPGGH